VKKQQPFFQTSFYWFCIPCIFISLVSAQEPTTISSLTKIASRVYVWDGLPVEEKETGQTRPILAGSTTHLEYFEIHATTLKPNMDPQPAHVHDDLEELIIVKEGVVAITIENDRKVLGPGSVALILPGDKHGVENDEDAPATYYILKYQSKLPMDLERGKKAGGSFMVDWNEVEYREHDKGGRRDFFDRPTAMCKDFEMHVTNLNEKTNSHTPHTHTVEEIILTVRGDVEMHIDGGEQKATKGDLAFVDSNIPHAATNIGAGQCVYFAFQWK
jgi:(S)-ureidoglycine aminohydrolase